MQEYDYIVVGAGSAGCALAHRLAYRQNHQVLLIEQGKKNRGPLFTMPKGFGALLAGEKYVSRYQAGAWRTRLGRWRVRRTLKCP